MFKIGLIGCGSVAMEGHLPAIREVPGLQLHAIFDPDPARLRMARERFHPRHAFGSMEAFYRSGLDAVVVTSPAPAHCGHVVEAALHRLPVLCEKPLALNHRDALRMIHAMKEAEVPIYTAFCYRFSPVALKIRELVASRAIGAVRSLRLIYNWDLHGKYTRLPNGLRGEIQKRREQRMLEGGPMIDCGTHQIDLAQFWLRSDIIRYSGHGAWVEEYAAPDHLWLHLDHANGVHTMVEISYSYHQVSKVRRREFVYELIGTEGVIRYDREARSFHMDTGNGRECLPFSDEKNFAGMYKTFASALTDGTSSLLPTGANSLMTTKVALRGTLQAIRRRSGEHITLPDFEDDETASLTFSQ